MTLNILILKNIDKWLMKMMNLNVILLITS